MSHVVLAGALGVDASALHVEHNHVSRRGAHGVKVRAVQVFGMANGVAHKYSTLLRQFLPRNHAQVTPCWLYAALTASFAACEHASASRRAQGGLVLATVPRGSTVTRLDAHT